MRRFFGILFYSYMLLTSMNAYAAGTLTISALTPGATAYVGDAVSFTASPSGFTDPTFLIEDNFGGTSITSGNLSAGGNFTWTPGSGDVGTHAIVVSAVDGSGNGANITQFITVSNSSLTLSVPTPGVGVDPGVEVKFTATVTGLTSPTYTVSDSHSGGTIRSTNIDSSGIFTWTPQQQDSGTHTITVTATDSLGRTKSSSVVISVSSLATLTVTLQSITPGTSVSPGQLLTFTAVPTSGAPAPTYSVTDGFFPSSITSSNISSSGVFTWTPNADETGDHRLTVYVTDSLGRSASVPLTVTVQTALASIQSLSPGSTVYVGKPVSFNIIATGFGSRTHVITDTFATSSVSNGNIDSLGKFSWTPIASDIGTHTITVVTSDTSGRVASSSQQIIVTSSPLVDILELTPGKSVSAGGVLTFTATTSGMSTSTFALIDTFIGSSLTSAHISASGKFSWTPKVSDVGVHQIYVYATELTGRSSSTSTTITVYSGSAQNIPASTISGGGVIILSNLALGSSGAEVLALQNALVRMGHLSATPNGYFGYQTQAAVKSFQNANGISAVGSVGPLTRALLAGSSVGVTAATSSQTTTGYKFYNPLDVGSRGSDVVELQKILIAKGLLSGEATGYYGALTQAAVKKYQAIHGLTQLGNVGPGTRKALNAGQ